MDKPEACRPCPWAQDMKGFVPDESNDSEVFHLMQNPGKTEVDCARPAYGQTGKDLDRSFLPLAGLERGVNVTVGNVLRCRWENDNKLPYGPGQAMAVAHCAKAHLHVPPSTRVIVAHGKLAFEYAHGGTLRGDNGKPASIRDWRGFVLPLENTRPQFGEKPVFVTLHVADLYHDPVMEEVTTWDYIKLRRFLDGKWPKPLPVCTLGTSLNVEDIRDWFRKARGARWVTVDTEYIPTTQRLTILGLLARYPDGTKEGLQVDWCEADVTLRQEVIFHYACLVREVTMVGHNIRADISTMRKNGGPDYKDYKEFHDTMLGHAVIWCELPHTLEFVSSVHGQHHKMKQLKGQDELLYNFGDICETDNIWEYLVDEAFKYDPKAYQVYVSQHLRLTPIVDASYERGLRVNKARVAEARSTYEALVHQALQLAQSTAGWPINLGSPDQLATYLYDIRQLEPQVNKDSGNYTADDEAIARLRMALGPAFDPDEDLTYEVALARIEQGADPVMEARVLFAGAQTRLSKYIYCMYDEVYKLNPFNFSTTGKYNAAYKQAIAAVKAGTATTIVDRVHPDCLIHAQKTGRWTYLDPPIAQLPAELRDIICPDPGEVWLSWDWSSIEPRILEAYCGSLILRKVFDEGIDLHTWTVCASFGYEQPPNLVNVHKAPENAPWRERYKWKGSDDPRRVFAKGARYEMYYGGTGNNAASAASLFGLDSKVLKQACQGIITADPHYYQWRLKLEETLKSTRLLRTFMGRPRRFLRGGNKMVREGLDQPMQGGTSDIANTTVVGMHDLFGTSHRVALAWTMHDSQKYHTPRQYCTRELVEAVIKYASREHVIEGRPTKFPISFEIIYPPGEPVIEGLEEWSKH